MIENEVQLSDPRVQALWFDRVRKAHLTETVEDYVELIADLISTYREARVTDLAKRFGVSQATVSKVISRLRTLGYIENRPHRSLFLTPKGETLAQKCKHRHQIILDFLTSLGISQATAEFDSEGLEHHVSDETLRAFQRYIKKNA